MKLEREMSRINVFYSFKYYDIHILMFGICVYKLQIGSSSGSIINQWWPKEILGRVIDHFNLR